MKRILTTAAMLFLGLTAFSCVVTHIGNMGGDCAPGETCECTGIGNCTEACTGKACDFDCSITGNCVLSCDQGGCTVTASGESNVQLDCKGGGCTVTCANTGTCTITGCEKDCKLTCSGGAQSCSQTCTDPSCTTN